MVSERFHTHYKLSQKVPEEVKETPLLHLWAYKKTQNIVEGILCG